MVVFLRSLLSTHLSVNLSDFCYLRTSWLHVTDHDNHDQPGVGAWGVLEGRSHIAEESRSTNVAVYLSSICVKHIIDEYTDANF